MTEIPEGMKALRDELTALIIDGYQPRTSVGHYAAERTATALLAPDGPLWPALRALGREAIGFSTRYREFDAVLLPQFWAIHGITGPLADACLAAAEVEP